MTRGLLALFLAILGISPAAAEPLSTQEALIARAKSFELDTPYVPPPGNPLEHHAAGFAKVMCVRPFSLRALTRTLRSKMSDILPAPTRNGQGSANQ